MYIYIYQINVLVFDFLKADTAHVGRCGVVLLQSEWEKEKKYVYVEKKEKDIAEGAVAYGGLYIYE